MMTDEPKTEGRCPICNGPVVRSFQGGKWRERWCTDCQAYTEDLVDVPGVQQVVAPKAVSPMRLGRVGGIKCPVAAA